jgi:hypothetical protein
MQNQIGVSWTDRNPAKVAVTSLLRRHSPSEAKKGKKAAPQPSIGQVGVGLRQTSVVF